MASTAGAATGSIVPGRTVATLRGSYANGVEPAGRTTFDIAFELVAEGGLGRLVTALYPLDRYREAIEHAANAGRRGAIKVAFDLRGEKRR